MEAVRNATTGTWHLIGARGCGVEPDGETVTGTWAAVRDEVERDAGDPCRRCNWPPA